MIRKLLLVLGMLVFSPFAVADDVDVSEFINELVGVEIPSPADGVFGNERVNTYIGDHKFGVITVDGVVDSIKVGLIENPTLIVRVGSETVTAIIESETPGDAFSDAFKDGKIKYEGVGFFKSIKFGILGFLAKIFI